MCIRDSYYNEVHAGTAFNKEAADKAGQTFKTILDVLGILEKEWKKDCLLYTSRCV